MRHPAAAYALFSAVKIYPKSLLAAFPKQKVLTMPVENEEDDLPPEQVFFR